MMLTYLIPQLLPFRRHHRFGRSAREALAQLGSQSLARRLPSVGLQQRRTYSSTLEKCPSEIRERTNSSNSAGMATVMDSLVDALSP